jgi:hypothetical protein
MKSYRTLNIILISICLLIDIGYFISEYPLKYYTSTQYPHYSSWEVENKLKQIDPVISTDLPHNQYQKLKQEQQLQRLMKNGDLANRSWSFFNVIGSGVYHTCDTCTIANLPPTGQSYISLPGWKLKSTTADEPMEDSVIFHVQNGQAYLRKSEIISNNNKNTINKKVIKDVPVKFMYSHESQLLKIPVSEGLMNTATIIMQIITALFLLISLYGVLLFTKLIINLRDGSEFTYRNGIWYGFLGLLMVFIFPLFLVFALFSLLRRILLNNNPKNNSLQKSERLLFTKQNIFRLQVLAYILTGVPIFLFLVNLLLRLIFADYFTEDVVLNTKHLSQLWISMHVGIIFFLILDAFMQGKALKDEQDLTV